MTRSLLIDALNVILAALIALAAVTVIYLAADALSTTWVNPFMGGQ